MHLFDLQDVLLVTVIFVPLERLVPLRPQQKILRRGWPTDLLHVLASGALIKIGITALSALMILASPQLVPAAVRAAVAAQPTWLAFIEILLLADLGFYLAHRAFHKVPWLWRFHAVHHSIEEMDWLAAHRVHPVDQILTKSASLIPIFALGFSPEPLFLFAVMYRWQALLIHSNVRIGFGPLRWIFTSPQFHHWHHANQPEAIDKNFAGQLSLLDLLFGTFHLPGRQTPRFYGTEEPVPDGYVGQLAYPFRWNNWAQDRDSNPRAAFTATAQDPESGQHRPPPEMTGTGNSLKSRIP